MHLLATVGTNPLPPFLAIAHLGPARVTLLASRDTKPVADRVRKACQALSAGPDVGEPRCVDDAYDGGEVAAKVMQVDGIDAVDVTGGTKVLAAHARSTARKRGILPEHITSLDGRALRRASGGAPEPLRLPHPAPTLDDLLALHGLRCWVPDPPEERSPMPSDLAVYFKQLCSADGGATGDGKWFEHWVAEQVAATGAPRDDLRVGMYAVSAARADKVTRAEETDFEVDVVLQRGWRLGVISCGVGLGKELALKPWEVAVNARRLGGDQALAAVAAPYPSHRTGKRSRGGPRGAVGAVAPSRLPTEDEMVSRVMPLGPEGAGEAALVDSKSEMVSRVEPLGLRVGGASVKVFGCSDLMAWQQGDRSGLAAWLGRLAV